MTPGRGHPECSARLDAAAALLRQQAWYPELVQLTPRPAEARWIGAVHRPGYADRIAAECAHGAQYIDTPDVAVSTASCAAALTAAGSLLTLADRLMAGQLDNGFALVRPPGHHAEADAAMGFCLFNSVAIAARYLQKQHGLERIAILDWDVHHGNGTQHIFEQDPSVFYISLHQYPHYPGTGARTETGIGAGAATTLNCPMSPGSGDRHYRAAFKDIILPAMRRFGPDAILLSAGFDAHRDDPLASIELTTDSYVWMTEMMLELAADCGHGRLISVLEGGYNLSALAASVTAHVRIFKRPFAGRVASPAHAGAPSRLSAPRQFDRG